MKTRNLLTLLLMLLALMAKADDMQVVTTPQDGCFTICSSAMPTRQKWLARLLHA